MRQRDTNQPNLVWLALALVLPAVFLATILAAAKSSTAQPNYIHNACTGNCVADMVFLHSSQGDTSAKNSFHGWFGSYWELTGCGESQAVAKIEFLLDIAAELVEAPGGTTMQCWQGITALASQCSSTCSGYFQKDGAYAPNIHASLQVGEPGYAEVNIDNTTNGYVYDGLPEREPNAYSRPFNVTTFLKYGTGPSLPVASEAMPSLSFRNWITRGGWDSCALQYGSEETRCALLENFLKPSEVSASASFGKGALYKLTGLTSNGSAVRGSADNGYLLIETDGARVTLNQGPYSGLRYVWTHNKTNNTYQDEITAWDASSGPVSFSNSECNAFLCGLLNDKIDRDTYIFALQGPDNRMLLGDYHVNIEARLAHDRDLIDNSVSYDYSISAPPANTPTPASTPTPSITPTRTRTPTRTPTPTLAPCIFTYSVTVYSGYSTYSLPLADARVLMQVSASPEQFEVGRTNAQGNLSGGRLIPGGMPYRIGVQKDGYRFSSAQADGAVFSEWIPDCQPLTIIFFPQTTPSPTRTATMTPIPHFSRITFTGLTTYGNLTTALPNVHIHLDVYFPDTSSTPYNQADTSTNTNGYYYFTLDVPDNALVKVSAEKIGHTFTPTWAGMFLTSGDRTLTYNFSSNLTLTSTFTRTSTRTKTPTFPPTKPRTATRTPTRTATPPAVTSNDFWGRVTLPDGTGIPGMLILMQVNGSDALQIVATTDSDGYYKNYMDLENGSLVRVSADKSGYRFNPSSYDWTQLSGPEDRLMNFVAISTPRPTPTGSR